MTGVNIFTALWWNIPQSQEELNFLRTIIYRRQIWIGIVVWILALVVAVYFWMKQYRMWKYQIWLTELAVSQSEKSFRLTKFTLLINSYREPTLTQENKNKIKKEADDAENEIMRLDEMIILKTKHLEKIAKNL
jgi:hypothetical protein